MRHCLFYHSTSPSGRSRVVLCSPKKDYVVAEGRKRNLSTNRGGYYEVIGEDKIDSWKSRGLLDGPRRKRRKRR